MNIDELIHDLRARINPQYFDQPGTESHERYQVVMALEYLRQENDSQRFDILAMNQSLDLLREENERMRKDAEQRDSMPVRYVSLQHIKTKVTDANPNPVRVNVISERNGAWLDMPPEKIDIMRTEMQAAIDAARGGK